MHMTVACATRYFQTRETLCNVTFQQMFHLLMGGKSCNSFLQRNYFLCMSTYACFCLREPVLANFLIGFINHLLKSPVKKKKIKQNVFSPVLVIPLPVSSEQVQPY